MSRTSLALGVLGATLLVLTGVGLALDLPRVDTPLTMARKETVVGLIAVAGLVYFLAVAVVVRLSPSRRGMAIVIGVAVLMRLAFVFGHPVLSSDMYRYVWDGQVQKAGINPYRYIPIDAALKPLRDPNVFPLINRADYAHTIYPPAAQAIFAVVGRITASVTGMKIAMVVFELLACLCLVQLLDIARLPRERVLIYAWNPLAQWSFAYDGHIDAAIVGLLALALLLRARHRTGLAGAVLATATLVKFLPLVVAPAFVRGGRFWRPALSGTLVIALLYALYASVGWHVFGFLPGYNTEEGLSDGGGIWLVSGLTALGDKYQLFDLPDSAGIVYLAGAGALLALLGIWIARRRLKPYETDVGVLCRDTAILVGCALVAISPHFPWYFPWAAIPAVIAPIPAVIWLSVAPVFLYLNPSQHLFWATLIYFPALLLAGLGMHSRTGAAASGDLP